MSFTRYLLSLAATSKSAGYDIYVLEDTLIDPGERAKIKTGIALLLPEGVHGELRARSSMSALRLDLLPGIIDQDYTGELIVVLENNRALPYEIKKNERCCQLILQKTFIPQSTGVIDIEIYQKVSQLYKHDRVGGFGSTN